MLLYLAIYAVCVFPTPTNQALSVAVAQPHHIYSTPPVMLFLQPFARCIRFVSSAAFVIASSLSFCTPHTDTVLRGVQRPRSCARILPRRLAGWLCCEVGRTRCELHCASPVYCFLFGTRCCLWHCPRVWRHLHMRRWCRCGVSECAQRNWRCALGWRHYQYCSVSMRRLCTPNRKGPAPGCG